MSINQKCDLQAQLYRLRAELGACFSQCQANRALHIGVNVQGAQNLINEALQDLKPDAPDYYVPPEVEFPTTKKL